MAYRLGYTSFWMITVVKRCWAWLVFGRETLVLSFNPVSLFTRTGSLRQFQRPASSLVHRRTYLSDQINLCLPGSGRCQWGYCKHGLPSLAPRILGARPRVGFLSRDLKSYSQVIHKLYLISLCTTQESLEHNWTFWTRKKKGDFTRKGQNLGSTPQSRVS